MDPDGGFSRAERQRGSGAYQSAVPPQISGYEPQLPSALAADVDDASQSLKELDSYSIKRLGPESPALGPMSAILLRTESATSSQIEQLTAGARQIALAELHESQSENARTVVANVRAMEAALALSDDLSERSILAMHNELLSRQPGWEEHAGRYRGELVWIGGERGSPRGARHIAPHKELIDAAMGDLVSFIAREDLPVLVQSAVAHAQFETIHPFADGNGRTGRALVQAMLRGKELVRNVTAPISAGLLRNTDEYFDALQEFRTGAAAPIVEQFNSAARYAASSGRKLVDDLASEQDLSREKLGTLRPQAGAWMVLPHLIAQPVVNTAYLQEHLAMNAMSAGRALDQLSEAGVLVESTGLRRNRVWQQAGVLAILDGYAAGIRRL